MQNKSPAQRKYEKQSAFNVPTRTQLIARVREHIRINDGKSKGIEAFDSWVRQDTESCKSLLRSLGAGFP